MSKTHICLASSLPRSKVATILRLNGRPHQAVIRLSPKKATTNPTIEMRRRVTLEKVTRMRRMRIPPINKAGNQNQTLPLMTMRSTTWMKILLKNHPGQQKSVALLKIGLDQARSLSNDLEGEQARFCIKIQNPSLGITHTKENTKQICGSLLRVKLTGRLLDGRNCGDLAPPQHQNYSRLTGYVE
jgi:hypothetical protein